MIEALLKHRTAIVAALERISSEQAVDLELVAAWGADLRHRMFKFAKRGKCIRGALVAAGLELFGQEPDDRTYTTAAAVELVQSFLLIHDDIMDEDQLRRGRPAIHEQYRKLGESRGVRDAGRFGESMAICAGDVAVLLALEAIAAMDVDPHITQALIRVIAHEIAAVGVAQMADVANGHGSADVDRPTEADIVSVYRYKTGRYTFSMPLTLGAVLANACESDIQRLAAWGEIQGVIFQIRDDQLDLFGSEKKTGKPAGTDIMSGKQTLHYRLLFDRVNDCEREKLRSIFGTPRITREDLAYVRSALETSGVIADIERRVNDLSCEAAGIAGRLETVTDEGRHVLHAISHYNKERET